jgi:hypothetical protein
MSRSGNNIKMDRVRQAWDRAVVKMVMNLQVLLNKGEGFLDNVGEHQLHGVRQSQVECWSPVHFHVQALCSGDKPAGT